MMKTTMNSTQLEAKPFIMQPAAPMKTLVRKNISLAPRRSESAPHTGPSRATMTVTSETPSAHVPVASSELRWPGPSPTARDLNQIGMREHESMVKAELPTS